MDRWRKYWIFRLLCNLYSPKIGAKNRIDSPYPGAYTKATSKSQAETVPVSSFA